jgi:sugar/nucleoside kinase (ribokinase family)
VASVAHNSGFIETMEAGLRRTAALAAHVAPPAAAAVLVGGAVLDVQAWPSHGGPQAGTTVPGAVLELPGGVARNIAALLAALKLSSAPPPLLLSCVGDDSAGRALLETAEAAGMSTRGVRVLRGERTATVVAVFDTDGGDIAAAVADCELLETGLTCDWLSRFQTELAAAPVVLLDTNAGADALAAAANLAGGLLWLEPVSVAKAARAAPLLRHAAFVSPNAAELVALASAVRGGRPGSILAAAAPPSGCGAVAALCALRTCIDEVLLSGCAHVLTTLGADGALLSSRQGGATTHAHLAAPRVRVLSTSGAGDALVAGALAALCRGEGALAAAAAGVAAAAVVVGRPENVPTAWPNAAAMVASAAAVLAGATQLA